MLPTKDLATWSSTSTSRSQSRNSITLTAFTDSTTMCFNGTYIVAVYGADAPSTVPTMRPGQPVGTQFTFTASTREVQLSAGQPYFGAVTQVCRDTNCICWRFCLFACLNLPRECMC